MVTAASCYSPEGNREWADRAVYGVLDKAEEKVLGEQRDFVVERPVDTLRKRLLILLAVFLLPLPADTADARGGRGGGARMGGGRRGRSSTKDKEKKRRIERSGRELRDAFKRDAASDAE